MFDCVRPWAVDAGSAGIGDVEGKMADLGLPLEMGAGDADVVLAKGLLRRCAILLALKAMARQAHQQHQVSRVWRKVRSPPRGDALARVNKVGLR